MNQCISTPTRRPSSGANHGREDPFASRKSFPVFDHAIRTETTMDENSLEEYDGEDIGESDCSYESSTDRLNLSIGARAALDEHLRHIAKFGIDDSQCFDKACEEDCSFESHQKDPRDVLWHTLVDPNFSHNATNNSTHLLSRDVLKLIKKAAIVQSAYQSQDSEALNDQSSDYFNSSRVYLLKTPERNRSHRPNAVTCRNDDSFVEKSSAASESPASLFRNKNENCLSMQSEVGTNDDSPSARMPRNDHSFLFSAVDLSRISDDGSEERAVKASPRTSFASRLRESPIKTGESGGVFPLTKENLQRIRKDNSPPSQRKDVPLLDPNNHSFDFHSKQSPPSTPQFLRRDDMFDFAENLALSPIDSRSRQNTPSSKLLQSPAPDKRSSLRSPPSPHDYHISSMLAENCSTSRDASDNHDLLTFNNSVAENSNSKHSLSNPKFSNDSPKSSSSAFLLRDRRRFRTVVPTRVFFTDTDDFPEEYDSFSVPPTSGSAQQSDSKTIHTTNW